MKMAECAGLNYDHLTFPDNIYDITAVLVLLSNITGALVYQRQA